VSYSISKEFDFNLLLLLDVQKHVMGPGQQIYGLGLENFPLKFQTFQFFPSGQKKSPWVWSKSTQVKAGRPLIYCGSKVCSGWVRSGPISNKNLAGLDLQQA